MNSFLHTNDSGDLIVSLAAVKAAGGGRYFINNAILHPLLKTLFERQPYIESCSFYTGQLITHNFSTFRKAGIPYGVRLGELHSRWIGVEPDFDKPWLSVDPSPVSNRKIVINRTARYQNPYFPWKKLTEVFANKMLFVGHKDEWKKFCVQNKCIVEYIPTKTMLDVAQLIAGSELFIGNQSSPNSIAEGLKHRMIQETSLMVPDCIFLRDNAIHCYDGNLSFELFGTKFESAYKIPKAIVSLHETPPGGWKIKIREQEISSYDIGVLKHQVAMLLGNETPANLHEMILEYTTTGITPKELPVSVKSQMERVRSLIVQYPKAERTGATS